MNAPKSIWIGYDPREIAAYAVCRQSIELGMRDNIPTYGVDLANLKQRSLYTRPQTVVDGQMWDTISEAPMSTEFACSRFLVPIIAVSGWALFMDCDMMARADIDELFALADPSKAVMVVKHKHEPEEGLKMDGQLQTRYARKNWSSVMLFNCDHEANKALTLEMVNTLPGRDLHRFCWLEDDLIGELPQEWNYLVGHTDPTIDAKLVHWTDGFPLMPGYESAEYHEEWFAQYSDWIG